MSITQVRILPRITRGESIGYNIQLIFYNFLVSQFPRMFNILLHPNCTYNDAKHVSRVIDMENESKTSFLEEILGESAPVRWYNCQQSTKTDASQLVFAVTGIWSCILHCLFSFNADIRNHKFQERDMVVLCSYRGRRWITWSIKI